MKYLIKSFFILLILTSPVHALTIGFDEIAGLSIDEGSGGAVPPTCFSDGHACAIGTDCCGTYCNTGFCSSTPPVTWTPRLMPFGDSITFGSGSTPTPLKFGWRDDLQDFIGVGTYDFVGPFTDPDTSAIYDVDHNGRGGDDTRDLIARLATALSTYFPLPNPTGSRILLMIGTNDIKDGEIGQTGTIDNVETIINTINTWDSSIAIYVGTIIPSTNSTFNTNFTAYNSALVTRLITLMASKANLHRVDMNAKFRTCNGGFYTACFFDSLHPNNLGYASLGDAWADCFASNSNAYCDGH